MYTIYQLRTDNCAFRFIDHEPWVALPDKSTGAASHMVTQ
jgi:hypothetical protein